YGSKMVESVTPQSSTFQPLPYRLEAGTPNIAAVIGFGAVLAWLQQYHHATLAHHTLTLANLTRQRLAQYPHCRVFSANDGHIVSFVFDNIENSDLSTLLSEQQIALSAGQHCASRICIFFSSMAPCARLLQLIITNRILSVFLPLWIMRLLFWRSNDIY